MDHTATTMPISNDSAGITTARHPARDAYLLLHLGFVAAPLLAGLDKFWNLLVDWEKYLSPSLLGLVPLDGRTLMQAVGVVEVIAGLLVAVKPKVGAVVVAGWLAGIIVNLLWLGDHYDVALRDFGLLLGALALSRLAALRQGGEPPRTV